MNWVFPLGPLETETGLLHVLTVMGEDRPAEAETAATALDALRRLVERLGPDDIVASTELREEAEALGVRVAPLPQGFGELRASQALLLGNGGAIAPEQAVDAAALLSTLADYVEAAPWEWLDSDTPLAIRYRVGRRRPRTLEASVLGNGGEVFGLALYDRSGSVAKLARGRSEANDVVLLSLDDEPRWAVEAMRAGFGLPFFPAIARVRRNQPRPLRAGDLRRLEAVLWAASQLEADGDSVEGEYEDDEGRLVAVHLEIGAPDPEPSAAPRRKTPRNAPCPCGSGRKYKRCCLRKQAERDEADPRGASRHEATLIEALVSFMASEAPEHGSRWFDDGPLPQQLLPILLPMLLFDLPLESGETLARRFQLKQGRKLDPQKRRRLEAGMAAHPSIWEVIRVDRGRGLELLDLLTGERCFVHEVSATRNMRTRAGLFARVRDLGDRREFDGLYPYPLAPSSTDKVVAAIRRRMGVRKTWVERERLSSPELSRALFELWHEQAELDLSAPEEPVEITNTDGEPAEQVCDRHELLDDPGRVIELLLELPGAIDRGVDEGTRFIDLVREGNAMHRWWPCTMVGELEVEGSTLRLRTNSVPRADALRELVEGRLGLFARFIEREREPLPSMGKPGGGKIAVDSQPASDWLSPPAATAVALQLRIWRHEPREELGGLAPKDAVARAASRRKVHALLRDFEYNAPDEHRALHAQLRRDLGVDEYGDRLRASETNKAKPEGISARLLEFATPVLLTSEDDLEGEAIVRVAADVWNFTGGFKGLDLGSADLLACVRATLSAHDLDVDAARVEAWIEALSSLRAYYDEPWLVRVLKVEFGESFHVQAGALSPP